MKVLHVAAEMTPIAKVGGLGDVLMGLTRELSWKGVESLAVIPRYGLIDIGMLVPEGTIERFETWFDGARRSAHIAFYRLRSDILVGLVDTDDGFWASQRAIYGSGEEIANFVFFSRAVADWLVGTKNFPDVIHVHDWQAALIPLILKKLGNERPVSFVQTIHNLEYQGFCQWHDLEKAAVSSDLFPEKNILKDDSRDCLNLLKAGILSADMVTTVSPTYAKEVRTDECGCGLQGVLSNLNNRFLGILNGVDYSYWNPEVDVYLTSHYGISSGVENIRRAKFKNRQEIGNLLGFPVRNDLPLIASITRLVPQKGVSFICDLFSKAEQLGFQAILLGSLPGNESDGRYKELDVRLREQGRGAVCMKSDESLAHKIYAAADIFVVPSIFEPCGLTQLIALKYGTIPVVRKTGGLADTIVDVDSGDGTSNGFVFNHASMEEFEAACVRALKCYEDKTRWGELIVKAMSQDFSWQNSTAKYIELYGKLV